MGGKREDSATAAHHSPPASKKRRIGAETCGLVEESEANGISLTSANGKSGDGAMALNGNGVNGAENGSGKPSGIDEGLYSRQLFVLGK